MLKRGIGVSYSQFRTALLLPFPNGNVESVSVVLWTCILCSPSPSLSHNAVSVAMRR